MTFTGTIQPHQRRHRVQMDAQEAARLSAYLRTLPAGRVVTVAVSDKRSDRASAYYWGVVVKLASEHTGMEPEDLHDEFCARFLTRRQIEVVDYATGEAEQVTVPGRSSSLSVRDFYEFVERVRQFLAEHLDVVTPDPDPSYWRKRAENAA
jgi:hypothetical protein